MFNCLTKLCQLLCLKNCGNTILRNNEQSTIVFVALAVRAATHLEKSVGFVQMNPAPSCDHFNSPDLLIAGSCNML
jgi:hypothetical protein